MRCSGARGDDRLGPDEFVELAAGGEDGEGVAEVASEGVLGIKLRGD
jgi:hypothetical protein